MSKTTDQRMRELQSAQRPYASAMQLPNPVMMWMSHKVNKPSHYKSQIQFELDTFICNNILLHSAKYYHLDFTILLSFHHTTSFMGEC